MSDVAKCNLGEIKRVDLRDVWPHEAHDFTKWLSEEPNLALLGGEIGIAPRFQIIRLFRKKARHLVRRL